LPLTLKKESESKNAWLHFEPVNYGLISKSQKRKFWLKRRTKTTTSRARVAVSPSLGNRPKNVQKFSSPKWKNHRNPLVQFLHQPG
jgi:hypothetical protein